MTQIVVKVKRDEIQSFKALLHSRTDIQKLGTTNPYEAFRVRYNDCLIIGYTSGKIVANKETARELISELLLKIARETVEEIVVGSDEAGKGEWLGPIVVAAVAVKPEQTYELQVHGVMGSKELSLPRIRELAGFIRDRHYFRKHVVISPRRFNELFEKLKDERRTLNDLLAWGHFRVIEDMLGLLPRGEKIKIIIDEFDKIKTENRLRRILNLSGIEVVQRPRAEENIAVAAASIIARDLREDYIDFLCKKLNKDLRVLSVEDAVSDETAIEYAKTSYLKRASAFL